MQVQSIISGFLVFKVSLLGGLVLFASCSDSRPDLRKSNGENATSETPVNEPLRIQPGEANLANTDMSVMGYQYNTNLREHPDCGNGMVRHVEAGQLSVNYGFVRSDQKPPTRNGDTLSFTSSERHVSLKKTPHGLDMVLAINTREAYKNAVPEKVDSRVKHCWPHMLVARNIPAQDEQTQVNLGKLSSLKLHFAATLTDSELYEGKNDPAYTGHFLFYIKVRNLEGSRAAWIGSDIYDYRYESGLMPLTEAPLASHVDGESNIQVVSLRGNTVPLASLRELMKRGNRVEFDVDLLPAISKSFAALKWDENLANYVLNHFNIGWESPGLFNGKMLIHDFNLTAVEKNAGPTPVAQTAQAAQEQTIKIHRFRNVETDDFLLSHSSSEAAGLPGWVYEGVAFQAHGSGIPIYRCLRNENQKHFESKGNNCEGAGKNEAVLFYGRDNGVTQVWRCYHSRRNLHLTTVDRAECERHGFQEIVPLTKI